MASDVRSGYASEMDRSLSVNPLVVILVSCGLFTATSLPGCGGARTRMIEGHTVVLEGTQDRARIAVDGRQVRVVYDHVEDRYRSPGCDYGAASTVDTLAEQIATSAATCEPLDVP